MLDFHLEMMFQTSCSQKEREKFLKHEGCEDKLLSTFIFMHC